MLDILTLTLQRLAELYRKPTSREKAVGSLRLLTMASKHIKRVLGDVDTCEALDNFADVVFGTFSDTSVD